MAMVMEATMLRLQIVREVRKIYCLSVLSNNDQDSSSFITEVDKTFRICLTDNLSPSGVVYGMTVYRHAYSSLLNKKVYYTSDSFYHIAYCHKASFHTNHDSPISTRTRRR